jgi:hypothetical protein
VNHPRVVTTAVAACLSVAGILVAAPPAAAGLPVVANAHVAITFTSTTFSVCATGSVDDGTGADGAWLFTVDGARANATPIDMSNLSFSESFSQCYSVPKNGTTDGGFVATLSFATVGSNSPNAVPDFSAVAGGIGTWDPSGAATFGT